MTKQEPQERPAQEWLSKGTGGFFIAVLVVTLVIYALTKGGGNESSVSATTAAQPRSCETWERTYAVIAYDAFPSDTLEIRRGEKRVVRLNPDTASGWVVFRDSPNLIQPSSSVTYLFPGGLELNDAPGMMVLRNNRDTLRIRGEGCVLLQAEGEPTKLIFSTWPKS